MAATTRIAQPAPIIVAGIRHKQTTAKIITSVAKIRDPKKRELALERAVFGGADERQRLVKLGGHCSDALSSLCFYMGTASLSLRQGDFRLSNADAVVSELKQTQAMINTLIGHFDSVHDLNYSERGTFFIALSQGADPARARRLALDSRIPA